MKRPLCLFVISFAIVSFIVQMLMTSPRTGAASESYPVLTEATRLVLTGCLYKKEIKNNRLIYYLKDVFVAKADIKFNSKQNPTDNFIWERQESGAVCYMVEKFSPGDVASPEDSSSGYSALSDDSVHPVGRRLLVRGTVLPSESAENDGQFDAAKYYQSIGCGIRLWDVTVVSQDASEDKFADALVDIKMGAIRVMQRNMQPENAGVLSAMLLGDKTSMDAEIKNLYRKNGIAHVLAISGLHISLLGMMCYRFLRKLRIPPRLCPVFAILLVLVYIKVIGVGVSSFRAVCMFVLYMVADLLNRTYDLKTALALSAFFLLVEDRSVLQEAGFLLSYLAVLALAVVHPVLSAESRRRAEFERQKRRRRGHPLREFVRQFLYTLQSNLLSGFSVQVFLFPITLWFYYEFPVYSFLLNLIVIPCMSVVLVSGIVGVLPLPGCGYVLQIADVILTFYEEICSLAENLPGARILTGRPAVWQMLLYYGLILLWLIREGKRGESRSYVPRFVLPLCCMLIFLVPVHCEARMDMLSVGQGDCVCIRDSKGNVALVDGGSTDVSEVGKYRLLPYLKYHGISEVDVVFISHAHADHYSAICELLSPEAVEDVKIGTVCLTKYALEEGAAQDVYRKIEELARRAGCRIAYLAAGDVVGCGEMKFEVVCPVISASAATTDENDRSMVLLATLGDVSTLFTGDASSACDAEVVQRLRAMGIRKIHCLKVAHHGAQTSTGAELLNAFAFDVALISSGRDNSYGHPHAALLERLQASGCKVFVTAECGQITVKMSSGRRRTLKVSVFSG